MATMLDLDRSIRLDIGDTGKTKVSAKDMLNAMNIILQIVWNSLAKLDSEYIVGIEELVFLPTKTNVDRVLEPDKIMDTAEYVGMFVAPLPDDFLEIVSIRSSNRLLLDTGFMYGFGDVDYNRIDGESKDNYVPLYDYRILGNEVYCRHNIGWMTYRKTLNKTLVLTDTFPLPYVYVNTVIKFTELVLRGKLSQGDSTLSTMIFADVSNITKKREVPYTTNPQEFFV